ncbi:MAG: undecaprenyl-diphosphate phosphatase [Clostridiales bacterium]|nr:undecaprenyl-diphosphate phosphatase [Clostridiales bacterium]
MDVIIEILKSIALGLVQGLGEFLPISSSGHLLLLERIFGITEGGRLMTIMLHVATLAAVCIVYREQIWDIIRHPLQKKTLWLIVATLVTVAITLAFKKVFDSAEDGRFLGICFLVTALLLTIGEFAKLLIPRTRTCNTMKWHHPLIIGALQGIAVFPGISRSGATITGALLCGVKKKDAAEFSFLLSIPAILGGLVLELPGLIKNGAGEFSWYGIVIGMIFAGVSGYFAVRFMLRLITKKRFTGFIIYTAALGVFLLLNQYVLHLF